MSTIGVGIKTVSQDSSVTKVVNTNQDNNTVNKLKLKTPSNTIVTKDTNNITIPKSSSKPMEKVSLPEEEEERDELTKAKDELGNKLVEDVSGKVTSKITEKVVARTGVKISSNTTSAFVETAAITLAKVEKNATGKFVTTGLKSLAKGVDKGMEKGIDKIAGKGINKLAIGVSTRISVKAASKIASTAPFLGTALGVYCTKEDIDDLRSKMKDKTVSKTSKALAGATVALDVISVGSSLVTAKSGIKGNLNVALVAGGINLAATGASIITSGLSEYYKNK